VEITPLISFKHLKMLNYASKCLIIIILKVFQNPKKKFKETHVNGGRGWVMSPHVKFMLGINHPHPPSPTV
jgi:hypothetical protein